jgi:Protein of unknown function (DUF1566)
MFRLILRLFICLLLFLPLPALAGDLDSPAEPDAAASAMFTLEDVFQRLAAGTEGVKRGEGFVEPASGPGPTGHTLNEVMAICPLADNATGALPEEVLAGGTYWSLRSDGSWGPQVGTMPIATLSDTTTTVQGGFYAATDLVTVDPDLQSGNLRAEVTVFGISGDPNVVDTSSGDALAEEILDGKKAWVDGVEVTGELQAECPCAGTLDGTRWCDNLDGTVTDLSTCLVWLKKADCAGTRAWEEHFYEGGAHTRAGRLYDGSDGYGGSDCALSDGSAWGSWRLPTLNELLTLTTDPERIRSDTPRAFTGVQGAKYWSSTCGIGDLSGVAVYLTNGNVSGDNMVTFNWVWPVRRAE